MGKLQPQNRPAPPCTDDAWQLSQTRAERAQRARDESLFALANGSLGVRGGFEEMRSDSDACFLAGVYERNPIEYHERFPGFARSTDTRVPVADGKHIAILLDGQRLDPDACEWLDFERRLDLRRGCLQRRLRLRTPQGATLQIVSERFVASDQDLLAIRYRVTSIDYVGMLTLESTIETGLRSAPQGHDPRIGISAGGGLDTLSVTADERNAILLQRTRRSEIVVCCGQAHRLDETARGEVSLAHVSADAGDTLASQRYEAAVRAGDSVALEKFVAYATAAANSPTDVLVHDIERRLAAAVAAGYAALADAQVERFAPFWRCATPSIDGNPSSELALRFNLFHLLQSASRSPEHGTAAKGLSGEGYEGHCFWDTEVFVLPVMVFTAPQIARNMLLYRHRTLDPARAHAREMNHPRGALYPWRTIAGGECSAHYPSGSAAYHINAAIAYAIGLYLDASDDTDFLLEAGAEMLFETARIWPQIGHFDTLRDGAFGIHGVTGPDEYSVLVDNNFYTNRMAQQHLLRAVAVWQRLSASHPQALQSLAARLVLKQDEVDGWLRAAEAMALPVDPHLDIYAQDDAFLHKPRWDFSARVRDRPLLLDYHPLTLYRHQVCKQADVVMALVLAGDGFDAARKRRSFDYYEAVTTHDSTLSAAVHGILASELGLRDKALHYFNETLRVDLDDLHGNTDHGVHMAAMAGSWMMLVQGFAGMRVVDGELHFAPALPPGWQGYGFHLRWRGRHLHVAISRTDATYTLLHGDALRIVHDTAGLTLTTAEPCHLSLAVQAVPGNGKAGFPRPCRALIFDLDGVLTDTADTHYRAWKRLADEIDVPFDRATNERLKGVDRTASLAIILERAPRSFSIAEKQALAERKNGYYISEIEHFSPQDLFPGAREVLDAARAAGLKLGLASASRNAARLLDKLGIADKFDYIADASLIVHAKPDPEIFLTVANALNVAPALCVSIEDAAAGISAIHAAGMCAIGIGDATVLTLADAVLPNIAALRIEDFVIPVLHHR